MHNAITYLMLTKIKNQLKGLIKSPAKLIYIVFLIFIIVMTVFTGNLKKDTVEVNSDIRELTAGITALYTLMFLLISKNGFGNGASMFTMSDINFVFPAPIKQSKVLFYGLFRQLGTSLLLGLFILFQYTLLHNRYGISYGTLLIILLGYAITVFLAQTTSMVIYSFTSASQRKKTIAKTIYFAIFGAFILYVLIYAFGDSSQVLKRMIEAADSTVIKLMPVTGWLGSAVSGIIVANTAQAVLGFALSGVYLAILICLITLFNRDYYEDVIKSTEIAQSAITARKEGSLGEAVPQNVRVGKVGLTKGFGANAFYYKHKVENRRSRIMFVSLPSLLFAAVNLIFAFITHEIGLFAFFMFATYLQVFSMAMGRINKELIKPFIYLVPEPPFKKLIFSLLETLPSSVSDAFIIFIPAAFIFGLNPIITILCILARISFAALFTAGNIVVERVWGGKASKVLIMLFYFLVMGVLAMPGIILAVVLYTVFSAVSLALLGLIICNIPISLLAFFLCKDMLQYAELNNN